MKRKSLTMILCLLTCLSLVGVGFAAWVITGPVEEDVTGNIVVDSVTDNWYTLTVSPETENIVLTGPSSPLNNGWLTSNAEQEADLVVEVSCILTKKSGEKFSSTNEANITPTFVEPAKENEGVKTAYGTAVDAGCFSFVDAVVSDKTLTESDTKLTFKVTITYKWGTAFGNVNPYDFYNDGTKTSNGKCEKLIPAIGTYEEVAENDATWADHANYYLRVLEAIQSTAAYSLTIAATPANA